MRAELFIKMALSRLWLPVAIGVLLRAFGLWGPDLWFDEVIYVLNSSGDFDSFVELTRDRNSSPFLLPVILWLFPSDWAPWVFRIPSAIAGISLILLVLWAQRKDLLARKHALIALWLLALNPFIIRYSQEVREYSIGAFFSMLVALAGYQVGRMILQRQSNFGGTILLLIALAITPHVSYGSIFTALAVITVLWLFAIVRLRFIEVILASFVLALSTALTWVFAASFQAGISKAEYLQDFYPETSGLLEFTVSLARALGGALSQAFGNPVIAVLIVLALTRLAFVSSASWRSIKFEASLNLFGTPMFFWTALSIVLLGGSLLAWALELFPMGAIRQQIPVAPVYLLWGALVLSSTHEVAKLRKPLAGVLTFAVGLNLLFFPWAYGPRNEVTDPVTSFLAENESSRVLYSTDPLLTTGRFYFPEVEFQPIPISDFESGMVTALDLTGEQTFLVSGDYQKDLVLSGLFDSGCELSGIFDYEGMTRTYLLYFVCSSPDSLGS